LLQIRPALASSAGRRAGERGDPSPQALERRAAGRTIRYVEGRLTTLTPADDIACTTSRPPPRTVRPSPADRPCLGPAELASSDLTLAHTRTRRPPCLVRIGLARARNIRAPAPRRSVVMENHSESSWSVNQRRLSLPWTCLQTSDPPRSSREGEAGHHYLPPVPNSPTEPDPTSDLKSQI